MSLLHQPHWQDLSGNPRTGVNSPTLVMCSGRMTPQRHGEIRQIYQRFCMAKLTAVGDFFVFNRVLSDGTRVRLESMQGKDRVLVWASDAQREKAWDYGWTFTPATDTSMGGFIRRPGAKPDDLSASAFAPVGSNSNGKAVHTFVDGATASRTLCTTREGGSRMWRSAKAHATGSDSEMLTYDHDAVYISGVKAVLDFEGTSGLTTHIAGAAIAKRGAEKWLVFIVSGRLGAIRLRELKPVNKTYINCGVAFTYGSSFDAPRTLWEFAPNGLKAIALGGQLPAAGVRPVDMRKIYRLELVPQNGMVPFQVQATQESLEGTGVRKRASNTFHFNQATRNFHFESWRDFQLLAETSYYGFIRFDLESGWGPTFTLPGNPEPVGAARHQLIGAYFDPRMSSRVLNAAGSQIVDHVDPTNFTKENPEVEIPRGDFLYDDGYSPAQFLYTRRFDPSPATSFPGANTGEVGRWFAHLNGWLLEIPVISTYFLESWNTTYEPYRKPGAIRHNKYSERLAIATVEHKVSDTFAGFSTLENLADFGEDRWGSTMPSANVTVRSSILYNYADLVAKNDYTSYIQFYEYLAGKNLNLIDRNTSTSTYVRREVVIDYQNDKTTLHVVGQEPAITDSRANGTFRSESFSDVMPDGSIYTHQEVVEETNWGLFQRRTEAYRLKAAVMAHPIYTHNWTTDWVLDSSVYLTGKSLIAAGYDKSGKEHFLYFEGDSSKQLKYQGTVSGADVPAVQLSWAFTGALGYRLKLGDALIDECEYAVFDAVSLLDGGFANAKYAAGDSPAISSDAIYVQDFDMAIGHVLYRKCAEKFEVSEPQNSTRLCDYSISISDLIRTPKGKFELGITRKIQSSDRAVKADFKYFANTKNLFSLTAPFLTRPKAIQIDGVLISSESELFQKQFDSIVPKAQRAEVGSKSGKIENKYEFNWLRYMVLFYPGVDDESTPMPNSIVNESAFLTSFMDNFGRFNKPVQSNMRLRSFTDDCWMVCYQNEKYIQSVNTENTTARYFVKTGKKSPVREFEAATYFPYLGASKKLLAPKFHIRRNA